MSYLPQSETEEGQQEESSQGAAHDDPGGNSLISFFPDLQNYLWMTQDCVRFYGTSNNPHCDVESEMTTEAAVGYTLNRGLKHRFRCCDSTFYSRILHVRLPSTSVFRVDFLFHTVGAWASTLANRWQQRLVQPFWVLQHVLQVLSVPRHHNSGVQQRLAEVEPADNHMFSREITLSD